MPPLVVPDTVQVTINGDAGDGPFANVFALDVSGASGAPVDIADEVITAYVEEILPNLCSSVAVQDAYYIDMRSLGGDTGTVTYGGTDPLVGGVNAPACPPQVCALITLDTTGGRATRGGRTFLPGIREDEVSSAGNITSATQLTLTTAYNTFMTAIATGSGAELGVLHRTAPGGANTTLVTSAVCQAPVATLRDRLHR